MLIKIISFQGEKYFSDTHTWNEHFFNIYERTERINIRFHFSPLVTKPYKNYMTLGIFDSQGFRGWAHKIGSIHQFFLSTHTATPGFIPGILTPGQWKIVIAHHMIVSRRVPCVYEVIVDVESLEEEEVRHNFNVRGNSFSEQGILNKSRCWYRGELHSHTNHSDAEWDCQELVQAAEERELDFLASTDHNTISPLMEISSDKVLIIPGMEFTTFEGHALALGITSWIDWRSGDNGRTMNDIARETRDAGGLFIIAHPFRMGDPVCTGCRWSYKEMDPSLVDGIEVWSRNWDSFGNQNPWNLEFWEDYRRIGHTPTAIASCDVHNYDEWGNKSPACYVFADGLSLRAILEGIRQGRVINTSGPWLCFNILDAEGNVEGGVGDTIFFEEGQQNLIAVWKDVPEEITLFLLHDHSIFQQKKVSSEGSLQFALQDAGEYRLELRAENETLLAITNPVILKRRTTEPESWRLQ